MKGNSFNIWEKWPTNGHRLMKKWCFLVSKSVFYFSYVLFFPSFGFILFLVITQIFFVFFEKFWQINIFIRSIKFFFEEKIEFFVIKPKFTWISEIFVNQNYWKIKELFSNYNIDRKNKNTKPYMIRFWINPSQSIWVKFVSKIICLTYSENSKPKPKVKFFFSVGL